MSTTNDEQEMFEEWVSGRGYDENERRLLWFGWRARSQSASAAQGEAQVPFGWAVLDKKGCTERVISRVHYEFAHIEPLIRSEPDPKELLAYLDREYKGAAPHRLVTLYTTPQPSAPGVVSDAQGKPTTLFSDTKVGDVDDAVAVALRRTPNGQGGESTDYAAGWRDACAYIAARRVEPAAQPSADDAPRPIAFVPVHPITGPLWADAYSADAGHESRALSYERMPLFAAPPADARDAERIKFIAERMTEMTVEEDHEGRLYTINFTNPGARPDGAWVSSEKSVVDCIDMALAGRMGENGCNELLPAWPECSGDPACCPENEGYGCCKPHPADRAMGGES